MTAGETKMVAALERFGWTCGPQFWERYYVDAWVFNLANSVDLLTDELAARDAEIGRLRVALEGPPWQ